MNSRDLNIDMQLLTVKLELCTDNKANLRVNSGYIASQFNAVSCAKGCLRCSYNPELWLFTLRPARTCCGL